MDDPQRLRRIVRQRLESLLRAGVVDFPVVGMLPEPDAGRTAATDTAATNRSRAVAESAASASLSSPGRVMRPPAPISAASLPSTGAAPSGSPTESLANNSRSLPPVPPCASADERHAALEVLQNEVCACTLCPALVQNRSRTVFGVGNIAPRLCIFGEAPGADEDRQGVPFVGHAGQLLDKILAACTLQRNDVYILNTLKCRPPDNRTPTEDEVENCRGFFERQLQILRPEFICCLGATAAKALLRTTSTLGRLRGRFHDVGGAKVIVTYHPAYLLRNPAAKKDTWEDMKLLMKEMGIALPRE